MRDMIISELTQAMHDLARGFAHYLPRLIVMLVFVLLGWLIAYVAKVILRGVLRLIKFDRISENTGASQLLNSAALPPASEVLSRFVFWLTWLGFILLGVSVLGILGLQEEIAKFFIFLPRLFAAVLILFFGLLAAGFFARAALLAAVNANMPSPRLLGLAIRSIIIVFVLSIVFEEVGVAEQTMLVAFGIAFGALMFGLAIAFGFGGRELAQRFLEEKFVRNKKEQDEDELSPL